MIRKPAALDLARTILEPYIRRGLVDETHVAQVARLIELTVEVDESDQVAESFHSSLADSFRREH